MTVTYKRINTAVVMVALNNNHYSPINNRAVCIAARRVRSTVGNHRRLYRAHLPCTSAVPAGHHRVLSTAGQPLSLFISYSPMVGVPWRNFRSTEFDTNFQREVPLFLEMPNFLKTQRSTGRGKPVCKKSARSVQPFRYNTGVWQTHRYSTTVNTRASIASRG